MINQGVAYATTSSTCQLYINDMCNVSMLMKSIVFADDTNSFYSGDNHKYVKLYQVNWANYIPGSWFQFNKLSLNIAKTNFMIFGNKQCEDNHVVSINGMNIKRVYVTKFLGVHIDSHLNWCEHINHIISKISKSVSIYPTLYSLYSTLVMPYLNYCFDIWGNTRYLQESNTASAYYSGTSYPYLPKG